MGKIVSNAKPCSTLPKGWLITKTLRTSGQTRGRVDKHYLSPTLAIFRSLKAAQLHIANNVAPVVAPVVVPEVVDVNRDCLDDETGDAIAECTPAVPTWAAGLVCNDRGATPAGSDDDFKPPALVGTKLDKEMVAISSDNAGC